MMKYLLVVVIVVGLSACQKNPTTNADAMASATASVASLPMTHTASTTATTKSSPMAINWAVIDSGVKAVDKDSFAYTFALDSAPVKAYMQAYHVDAKTARYNLTVGMAVNEVLNKVLDQIGTAYVSHELTAGNDSQFIIHTTAQIAPSTHTYVFDEPFAHGLSMPIVIINDGKK